MIECEQHIRTFRDLLDDVGDSPCYGLFSQENYDRVGKAAADQENPECLYVRNGVFEPLKRALASSKLHNKNQIRRRHSVMDDDYVQYLRDLSEYNNNIFNTENQTQPSISYNPAYSDYLPINTAKKVLAKNPLADSDLTPLSWTVPFRGDQGTYCGYRHVLEGSNQGAILHEICPECMYIRASKLHCWRPGCPICAWDWCCKKAREVTERLESWESLQDMRIGMGWRHVVVAPPQEDAAGLISTKEGLDYLYKTAFKMVSDAGLKAGFAALHVWRRNGKDIFESSSGEISKEQSFVWRVGPHFHFLAWGRIDINTGDLYRDTGWIMKMIGGSDERVSLSGTIAYILSHSGLAYPVRISGLGRQLKAFRLFGDVANGSFRRVEVIKQDRVKRCPNCKDEVCMCYLTDDAEPVSYIQRTQAFCLKKDYNDVRKAVLDLRADMRAAELDDVLVTYNVLEFYKRDTRVALSSKLHRGSELDSFSDS